jgi:hypothetical protein
MIAQRWLIRAGSVLIILIGCRQSRAPNVVVAQVILLGHCVECSLNLLLSARPHRPLEELSDHAVVMRDTLREEE